MLRIALCLSVLFGAALPAAAQDATFDQFTEGVIAATFSKGGITFSNLDCNLGSPTYSFIAEQADGNLTGMPGFSAPNCLGFTGYSPGSGAAFGRVLRFDMTNGQVSTEARLELFELGSYAGNTVSLHAFLGGNIVATHTAPIQGGFSLHHYVLQITGVAFDMLRVEGGGPNDNGVFFGLIDGVHIGAPPVGTVICTGDGSGTACPCGNASPVGAGEGCLSSLAVGGTLRAIGAASLSNDSLVLNGAQMPNSSALYFQGTSAQAGGAGAIFGDGLRCVGGTVVRLGTKTNLNGASQYPAAGDASVSVRGQVTAPGVRVYQTWYRNAAAFCTPATFNLTNGLQVTWGT